MTSWLGFLCQRGSPVVALLGAVGVHELELVGADYEYLSLDLPPDVIGELSEGLQRQVNLRDVELGDLVEDLEACVREFYRWCASSATGT